MVTHEDDIIEAAFLGYTSPNYTQVPDELFDQQLPDLSGAELKVLLYIMRRTFGFKKDSDDISLNQICRGITTRDGRVLDRGTGLSKSTAQLAIKGLLKKNIILTTKRVSREKGNEATTYELNVPSRRPYTGNRHRGPIAEIGIALYRKSAQQETVRQYTDRDISNFEGSPDNELMERSDTLAPNRPRQPEPTDQSSQSGHDEPQLLSEILHQRARSHAQATDASPPPPAGKETPRRTGPRRQADRADADPEAREQLRAFLADFAIELGDEAPLASTITRTLNMFTATEIPPEQWGDYLYQARGLTQEHTGQIRKLATGDAPIRRKNKMPYFLATLEHLVGLRPDAPASPAAMSDTRHIP